MQKTLPIHFLQDVLNANLCLGCGACQHVIPSKISLELEAPGYLRPHIDETLSEGENRLALSVCPGIQIKHNPSLSPEDELWGPILTCQAGWSTNEALRHKASSGGALSGLTIHLLETGMVDAVLHIGVAHSDPILNEYKISTTRAQVTENAGSRYAPGAPVLGLKKALSQHSSVAFIGKPCDVVAIRKLSEVDSEVKEKIKYCLSFMCAGVPSITGTQEVLKKLETTKDQLLSFKYRGDGWPGMATAKRRDGTERSMSYDDSWGNILNKHLQFRCKVCYDGTGEFSDITCADAWYGNSSGYPSFNEAQGRSLILARTRIGQALLESAIHSGAIETTSLEKSDLHKIQPYQANRKKFALSRILGIKASGKLSPQYSFPSMFRLSWMASFKDNLKSFVGTFKRSLQNRND
jgi:coenzyme F420 hydrogenase subunit beta